jgi:hypothetical protein
MDLGASRRKFTPLSQEEQDLRRINNLCLYCGQPGHRAAVCPLQFHRNTTAAVATLEPSAVVSESLPA